MVRDTTAVGNEGRMAVFNPHQARLRRIARFLRISRTRSRWATVLLLLAAVAVLAACPDSAWAIDVGPARWGFDGQATPHNFNLLSVLVSNPGPQPFEGTLELRQSIGGGTRVGAPLVEDLYIAPFSSRWVQFYPYVKERFEDWSLRWTSRSGQPTGRQSVDIPQPVLADQMPVWLVGADDVSGLGGSLRHFPENLFPPMVTATDTLKMVALDHVPQWEEVRRQSFRDWLFRGGQLHLFKDINGSYPQFSAGLAELNVPAEQFPIGAGQVFRHDRPRSQIDADFIAKHLGVSGNGKDQATGQSEELIEIPAGRGGSGRMIRRATTGAETADDLFADLAGGLFAFLKGRVRPHHNWTLIYSMAVFYILTVIPGVHILGRKRFDYRVVYGTLIGLIVLFSLGFAYIGRRGHDEANVVNSVAVARQLPDGALDVTAWSNVFVINGNEYAISRAGTGSLYSTAQTFEAVNGVIRNGAQGAFYVDIPPYSSQSFLHRIKLKNDRFEIKVIDFSTTQPKSPKSDGDLAKLVLATGNHFPRTVPEAPVYALYRDQLHEMTWSDGRLQLAHPRVEPMSTFLGSIRFEDLSPYSRYAGVRGADPQADVVAPFETLLRPLMAWSLGLRRHSQIATFAFPTDRVRLFVWAELPESLRVTDPRMGSQQGRMLYVVDIQKPVKL
jgi:hypothetical protein